MAVDPFKSQQDEDDSDDWPPEIGDPESFAGDVYEAMVGQVYWLSQFGDAEYPDKGVIEKRVGLGQQDLNFTGMSQGSEFKQHPALDHVYFSGDPETTPNPVNNEKALNKRQLALQKKLRLQKQLEMMNRPTM